MHTQQVWPILWHLDSSSTCCTRAVFEAVPSVHLGTTSSLLPEILNLVGHMLLAGRSQLWKCVSQPVKFDYDCLNMLAVSFCQGFIPWHRWTANLGWYQIVQSLLSLFGPALLLSVFPVLYSVYIHMPHCKALSVYVLVNICVTDYSSNQSILVVQVQCSCRQIPLSGKA